VSDEKRMPLDEIYGQSPLLRDLDEAGLTRLYAIRKLKAELNAKDTVEILDKEGNVVKKKHIPIWPIRQKARQDLVAYRGEKAPDKVMVGTIEQELKQMTDEDIERRLEQLERDRATVRSSQGAEEA